ncbi:MAG TPA: mitochondrial fission ELM1 family protein [Geminicoccaceae bacterium]|nr:mitochondrial fission ELM1 family protein [Geminicoccaceae bacterium]
MLTDGRPGHDHQALGVAEALGWPFVVRPIDYGPLARLPNALLGRSIRGLTSRARDALVPPWPDLVIGAGRRTAPPARWLKRRHAGTVLVQLMWPGSARDLDLVAVPEHDRVADRPGMIRTLGTPHRVTRTRLAAAAEGLVPLLTDLPRPRIACLVGGARRGMPFTPADAAAFARRARRLAQARGGSLLVATSRRTGPACEAALADGLEGPRLLHRFGAGEDRYLAILGSADAVVVTADSASMCSEACATGRPVFLDVAQKAGLSKLTALHRRLEQLGYLRPLGAPWPTALPPPLDPAATVAAAIRALLRSA